MDGEYLFYSMVEYLIVTVSRRHGITEEEAAKKVKAYLKKHNLI